MKLRIKGSSIRMRLTKAEVAQIREGLAVQETLSFGGTAELKYSLEPSLETQTLQARFENSTVRVLVPRAMSNAWASSEEVSLINTDQTPVLLIEKDFFCLKPRTHEIEDRSEMFTNPNEAHGSCGGGHSESAH